MSWVEIKHAINSTLGTTNMQSLDQMVKQSALHPTFSYANRQIFTANGTFTPITNVVYLTGIAAGGKGGTGEWSNIRYGGGGGCGNWTYQYPVEVTIGVPISVTVGSGNTIFGSKLTLVVGPAGINGDSSITTHGRGGASGSGYIGTIKVPAVAGGTSERKGNYGGSGGGGNGGSGGEGYGFSMNSIINELTIPGGYGGISGLGGGGGGAPWFVTQAMPYLTGATGAGGSGGTTASPNGSPGAKYGAGGGAGERHNLGGAGGPGVLIIEW